MSFGQLARDATVERRVVALVLRLERERGEFESVQDVAEVQLCERSNRLVRHPGQRTAGVSAVVPPSVPFPSAAVTWTTMAVMLSNPPRPFASEMSASTTR